MSKSTISFNTLPNSSLAPPPAPLSPLFPLQVRFDTDAELDLALRTSPSPLRIVAERPRGHQPAAGAAAANPPVASRGLPSTEGYAVASNVGFADGDTIDENMVMVDHPSEAGASVPPGGEVAPSVDVTPAGNNTPREDKVEIDTQTAFEAEAAAARDPEASELYKKASVRLAKRHGVHLTPTQLWRVMALLQIQGRQLVMFGLAPHRALEMSGSRPQATGASSDEETNSADKIGKKRGGGMGRGGRPWSAHEQGVGPIRRMLELNGVQVSEEEVIPLLEALRIRPRRLVRLKLLREDELGGLPDGEQVGRGRGGPPGRPMHFAGRFDRGGGGRGRFGGRGPPPPFQHFHMHPPPPFVMAGPPGPNEGIHHISHVSMFGGHAPPPHILGHPPHPPFHPPPPFGGPPSDENDGEADWQGGPPGPVPHPMWGPPPGAFSYSGVGHGYGFGFGGGGAAGGGRGCGGRGGKESMAMARFVEHKSPSPGNDVARVSPGQSFKKSWLVRNDSSTPWPEEVSLVPVSRGCQDLCSPPETAVVGAVAPGEEAELSVDLVAPAQAGMYEGFWRPFGGERKFGQRLWAKVMVVAPGGGPAADVDAGVERLSLDDRHKDK